MTMTERRRRRLRWIKTKGHRTMHLGTFDNIPPNSNIPPGGKNWWKEDPDDIIVCELPLTN